MTYLAQPVSILSPFGIPWGTPTGASDDADLIAEKYVGLFRRFAESATGNERLAEPFYALQQILERCQTGNWDGEGASPISPEAVGEAQAILLTLPFKYPLPDIFPEATGSIALEWYREPGYRFVATVSGRRAIEFAGLFGPGNEIYGEYRLQAGIPSQMRNHLAELFS